MLAKHQTTDNNDDNYNDDDDDDNNSNNNVNIIKFCKREIWRRYVVLFFSGCRLKITLVSLILPILTLAGHRWRSLVGRTETKPISGRNGPVNTTSNCGGRMWKYRTDSRFAPSQWETALQSNDFSHWLGANLESALETYFPTRAGYKFCLEQRKTTDINIFQFTNSTHFSFCMHFHDNITDFYDFPSF